MTIIGYIVVASSHIRRETKVQLEVEANIWLRFLRKVCAKIVIVCVR